LPLFCFGFSDFASAGCDFGVWFELKDVHHETFALASAALGFGVLVGALIVRHKS
jgi:hypothetical protein